MHPSESTTNAMWGGAFTTAPAALMTSINASIDVDKRLYAEDIQGSLAHAQMLAAKGIVSAEDAQRIMDGLHQIHAEITRGEFTFTPALEDIHMHIEARLKTLIGDAAGRLHTARSRNDQVATDMRLWVRAACATFDTEMQQLQKALINKASMHAATLMPGFTHLQTAQPITLGHHLLAYTEMFGRDRLRARDAAARMNECPLGSAALAGTSFPIDRHATAHALGFSGPCTNSLDGVSARDFVLEFLSVLSICAVHLSRMAEECILWTSAPFGFAVFSDAFSTGSSIMPQKRNPDAAELIRGKTGTILGALVALLTTMKALPLAYNKDMQEDKAGTFAAFDAVMLCVRCLAGMVDDLRPNAERMRDAADAGYADATDLADWLVRTLHLPFRDAHHVTGQIVKLATATSCALKNLPLEAMQRVEPRIHAAVYTVLGAEASVRSRTSFGGTAPDNVARAAADAKQRWL